MEHERLVLRLWEAVRAELRERGGEIESEDVLDALAGIAVATVSMMPEGERTAALAAFVKTIDLNVAALDAGTRRLAS